MFTIQGTINICHHIVLFMQKEQELGDFDMKKSFIISSCI